MKTYIINLFGPSGCGKSSGAAYIFSKLKMAGVSCELVPEYAKDKVWENNEEIFNHEFLEDCSDWVQKIVLQGQQMYLIETDFKDYLKRNGIFEKFLSMSASDKSTELVRFMNAANLSFERLKIN